MPSLPTEYFRNLYRDDPDPWRISSGWYEQRKRALSLAVLTRPRYRTVWEPGCANGELTRLLAARADEIFAWDAVPAAVEQAQRRTAGLAGVHVDVGSLPHDLPDGRPELVVLSELGYYFDEAALSGALSALLARLEPGGELLAAHWRRDAPDYPLRGDDVHRIVDARPELQHGAGYSDDDVLVDVWLVGPTPSVAQSNGVV